jgi:hypothetical protein
MKGLETAKEFAKRHGFTDAVHLGIEGKVWFLRSRIDKRVWAAENGISESYLSSFLAGRYTTATPERARILKCMYDSGFSGPPKC